MIRETRKENPPTRQEGISTIRQRDGSVVNQIHTWLNRFGRNGNIPYYRVGFHLLVLVILISLPILVFPQVLQSDYGKNVLPRLVISSLLLIPLYIVNIIYFIPHFLTVGQYRSYGLLLSSGCIFTVLIINILVSNSGLSIELNTMLGKQFNQPLISFMLLSLAISTVFELILNWERHQRQREQIEKEKILLELSFLKSQINPHFLFNTLNTIHSMSELKSDKTSDAILMLSDLLRYVLYGTNHGCVPLQKEIEIIENYIAIQRLRIPKRDSIVIQLDTRGHYRDSVIEPQLLLPFVENAFKHGISYQQKSAVLVNLSVENNVLQFRVQNTKRQDLPHLDDAGPTDSGIGLANIRRRLELLYPGKYDLQIQNEKDLFEIRLTVQLQP